MLMRIQARQWNPSKFKEIGRGGEAVVYSLRADTAAKVFLPPGACEFADAPGLQEAAKVRIEEMQTKLFEFPQDLPVELVVPSAVLIDGKDRVFGYTMPYIAGTALGQMSRTSSVFPAKRIGALLAGLHDLVCNLHARGVVLGDFNENNIIVAEGVPHLIDADSMQFGPYQCRSFVPRFTAPELLRAENTKRRKKKKEEKEAEEKEMEERCKNCKSACKRYMMKVKPNRRSAHVVPATSAPYVMVLPHSEMTDWYSFLVIAMRLITRTDPYGGVVPRMATEDRLRKRVTVFDSRCIYPRVARPLKVVSRPVLEVFFRMFHLGERFIPDKGLFTASGLWV